MNIGSNLKKARKDLGLTQAKVAEKLNVCQSNISDWENDVSRPEYENLVELAALYKVDIYDVLGVPLGKRFYSEEKRFSDEN